MEVQIWLPKKAKLGVVEKEYPDIYEDGDEKHDDLSYFVGNSNDGPNGRDFLTYQEAVECCGFVEGAIPGAECVMEGNGGWAMGMIKRDDFSSFAVSPQKKAAWKRRSNNYWKAFKRGKRLSANIKADLR
jgi:hypothetical protein